MSKKNKPSSSDANDIFKENRDVDPDNTSECVNTQDESCFASEESKNTDTSNTDINNKKAQEADDENKKILNKDEELLKKDEELRKKDEELQKKDEELHKKSEECEKYFSMLQRTAAEYDNFKKRTLKEKEAIYTDSKADTIAAFLPVLDNLERAMNSFGSDNNESKVEKLKEGVELILRQMKDVLKNLGVEDIKAIGEKFDPNIHNAVMHVEDENYGESEIIEEFQKGYMLKDKIIRFSMVKVAN